MPRAPRARPTVEQPPDNRIPIEQAARRVGYSVRSVKRWIHDGDISGWSAGKRGRVMVDPDELQRVMLRPIVAAPRKAAAG